MLGIAFILIAFIYKPATTGKVVNAPDKVSLRGLIASYLFEENVRDNLGNYNGVIKDIIPWTRIEDMNSAPNTKVWKLTKGNSCKISTKNSELTIFTKANEYCSYAINNIVDFSKGFTYEAKVRGLIKNPTMIVSVAEKNMHSDLWLNPRGICLNKNVTCKGLDETQDHVYRITIKNNITKLCVDNIYVGSAPTQISKTKANFIKFGDIAKTPASGSTLIFDYIRHYNKADESPLDYESGKNGKAASFKGISDYVTIPDRLTDGKNQLSISVWVKIDSFSKLGSIISKSNASEERKTELALRTTLDRKIQFELDSPSSLYIVETPQLTPNTWHHIIATYDGSNMKIYANGVLSESRVRHGNLLSINNLDLNIGANSIKTEFFNGAIDELDIYNRALNYSEVQEIYHGNCNIMLNNQNYVIEQDNFNTVLGRSYICYNRNVYSCKEYPNDFAEIKAQNLQQIGSWQCDLNSEQWISIIPRFRSISSSCYYGSNCGPISITSNAKGANIIYEIEWNYRLKNKSIIKNTQDIPFSNAFVETSQIISTDRKSVV